MLLLRNSGCYHYRCNRQHCEVAPAAHVRFLALSLWPCNVPDLHFYPGLHLQPSADIFIRDSNAFLYGVAFSLTFLSAGGICFPGFRVCESLLAFFSGVALDFYPPDYGHFYPPAMEAWRPRGSVYPCFGLHGAVAESILASACTGLWLSLSMLRPARGCG